MSDDSPGVGGNDPDRPSSTPPEDEPPVSDGPPADGENPAVGPSSAGGSQREESRSSGGQTPVDGPADGEARGDDSEEIDVDSLTTETRTLDPRVRWLWVARALVTAVVVGGVAVGITFAIAPDLLWVGGGVFLVALVAGVAHTVLLYRTWEYHVREDSMYLDRGVVTRVQTVVPYVRVQHIDTSRGPIERAVGLSSLVVYTAGSRGADVTIPGLTPAEATDLQSRLKVLAIESEGEDAV